MAAGRLEAAELDEANLPVDALPVYWSCLSQADWLRAYGMRNAGMRLPALLGRVLFEPYPSVRRFLVRRRQAAIGFFHLDFKSAAEAELSGGLAPAWQRRGQGPAAAALALSHAFACAGLRRLGAQVASSNPASRRLLERLGFVYQETRRRDHLRLEAGAFPNAFALALMRRYLRPGGSCGCS